MHRDTIEYLKRAFNQANRDLGSNILDLQDDVIDEMVITAERESLEDCPVHDLQDYMREWFRVDELAQLNLTELERLVVVLDEVGLRPEGHPLTEGLPHAHVDLMEDFRELRDEAVLNIVHSTRSRMMGHIREAFGTLPNEDKTVIQSDLDERMIEAAGNAVSTSPTTMDDVYAAAFDECEAFIITHPQSQNPTLRLNVWDTGERQWKYPRAEFVKKALAEAEKAAQDRGVHLRFPKPKPSMSR